MAAKKGNTKRKPVDRSAQRNDEHPIEAPGVQLAISDSQWRYIGTAQALIAARLVLPEWLRQEDFVTAVDGRHVKVTPSGDQRGRGLFYVFVDRERDDASEAWPPEVTDWSGIEHDDDAETYRGSAKALIDAGVLRPKDTPGDPACPRKWAHWSRRNGVRFGAMRLGKSILVQIY